eukprot:m.92152 g.92152  ORF g.92152 m.92152 type:complete len:1360 (+) comp13769_c0_seq1:115-4194(+)
MSAERAQAFDAADASELRSVCSCNGITREAFVATADQVATLEAFFGELEQVVQLTRWFTNLTELRLVAQPAIQTAAGVERCTLLERLWISETALVDAAAVVRCPNLRVLHLNSNALTSLPDLAPLQLLEELSVCNNQLTHVPPTLTQLKRLRILNLAGNRITTLMTRGPDGTIDPDSSISLLEGCDALVELNVSGNHLVSLLDVTGLAGLPLRSLTMADCSYPRTPLCALPNYGAFALYCLPDLVMLDGLLVTPAAKRTAAAAMDALQVNVRSREQHVRTLARIEAHTHARRIGRCRERLWLDARPVFLESKLAAAGRAALPAPAVQSKITSVHESHDDLGRVLPRAAAVEADALSPHLALLRLELANGGGIVCERSDPDTKWRQDIATQLDTRACAGHFAQAGFRSLTVLRAARIVAPLLESAFEAALFRQHMPVAPALEVRDGGSIGCTTRHQWERDEVRPARSRIKVPPSALLYYIASSADDVSDAAICAMATNGFASSASNPLRFTSNPLRAAQAQLALAGDRAVVTVRLVLARVPDAATTAPMPGCSCVPRHQEETVSFSERSHVVWSPLAVPLAVLQVQFHATEAATGAEALTLALASITLNETDPPAAVMPPKFVNAWSDILTLPDLGAITTLDLCNLGLATLPSLAPLKNVKSILAAFNHLTSVDAFASLALLEHLDLSFNTLTRFHHLRAVPSLLQLDLCSNQLSSIEDVHAISKHATSLHTLDCRNNPALIEDDERLHLFVAATLPRLTVLNGRPLRQGPVAHTGGLKVGYGTAPRGPAERWSVHRVIARSAHQPAGPITAVCIESANLSKASFSAKTSQMRHLCMQGNLLHKLRGVDSSDAGACNIVEADFSSNMLISVSHAAPWRFLRRLDLSNNCLRSLQGIEALVDLEELCASHNMLSKISEITTLTGLRLLFLACNLFHRSRDVCRLSALPRLHALDVTGNALADRRDFRHFALFHLPRLQILNGAVVTNTELELAKQSFEGKLTSEYVADVLGEDVLPTLRELSLPRASLDDLILGQPDVPFANLISVNLDGNLLVYFGALGQLPHLRTLSLKANKIRALQRDGEGQRSRSASLTRGGRPTSADIIFPKLESLHLSDNGIGDVTPLQLHRFPRLASLFLDGNDISTTTGLDRMTSLQRLVLDRNRVKVVEPLTLSSCPRLAFLYLRANRLRDLKWALALPSLQTLFVDRNKIAQLADVQQLAALTGLAELSVQDNPCGRGGHTRPSIILSLPLLRALDGTPVTREERFEAELAAANDAAPAAPPPSHMLEEPALMVLPPAGPVPRIPVVDLSMQLPSARRMRAEPSRPDLRARDSVTALTLHVGPAAMPKTSLRRSLSTLRRY